MSDLTAAFNAYPHTRPLLDTPVRLPGGRLLQVSIGNPLPVPGSGPGASTRMLRDVAFDLCEVPIVSYLAAREHHVPLVGLPIPVTRGFDHVKLIVNRDRGIDRPEDLQGKRVALRYHGFTDAVWARGVLSEQYGVDLTSITWVTGFEEVVPGALRPANVERRIGDDLDGLLLRGDVDALIATRPGAFPHVPGVGPLFSDIAAVERSWFEQTGVYPIHHVLVMREATATAEPDLAGDLVRHFARAKRAALDFLAQGGTWEADDAALADFSGFPTATSTTDGVDRGARRSFLPADPFPYGLAPNRPAFELAVRLAREMGIVRAHLEVDDLFVDPET
jgi:4,5-dihydroxyphthalate decarboxylase